MAILSSEPITAQEYNGFEIHGLEGIDEHGNLVTNYTEADSFDLCEGESKALCFGCFTYTDGAGWFGLPRRTQP